MATWLVTGAAGALGRAVVQRLQDQEQSVIPTTRSGNGSVQLDVKSQEQVRAVLAEHRPDVILHLAAAFTHDWDAAYAVNVLASRYLLEAVETLELPARLLLVGSAAEYGLVKPEANPIPVSHPLAPVSVYGLTKSWQTMAMHLFAARGVDVVLGRVFNLDGEGMSPKLFAGRVRQQAAALRDGQTSHISVGPLDALRDYCSTAEAARQLLAIARKGRTGGIYHVASGEPVTMQQVLTKILAECGLSEDVVRSDASLSNRKGHDVPAIYADMSETWPLLDGDLDQ